MSKERTCKEIHGKGFECSRECPYYDECITYENFVKNKEKPEPRPDAAVNGRQSKLL